jgi:TPR repeat protein
MYAQHNLASMYGTAWEWRRAMPKRSLVPKAAEQGHIDAQNELGFMYQEGRGVQKDAREGAEWYRKAADQGHASAQANLGVAYLTGVGVPATTPRRHVGSGRAADQGSVVRQYALAGSTQRSRPSSRAESKQRSDAERACCDFEQARARRWFTSIAA